MPSHGATALSVRPSSDEFLFDHLGGGFELLYFTETAVWPDDVRRVIEVARSKGLPLRVIIIGAERPVDSADLTLPGTTERIRQRYGVPASDAAYLRRPDQHVCARWLTLDANRLQTALPQSTHGNQENEYL